MTELCKITFDGTEPNCDGKSTTNINENDISEKIGFGFGLKRKLSKQDLQRKGEVQGQLINRASVCVKDGKCYPLDIIVIRWDKCEVCNKEIPALKKNVIEPLRKAGVSVLYNEMDAKGGPDGTDLFLEVGCQGTPCVLVRDPVTQRYKIGYEGRQRPVAALSKLLGLPNPLFYGDLTIEEPMNMLKPKEDFSILNGRSWQEW